MAISYTNLNFGNQGLKNLITASFTSSWITSSNGLGNPGLILANNNNYSFLTADGYYQIFPSRSLYNFDSLLPIVKGDIITFDSGNFGAMGGSITKKITAVASNNPATGVSNNIFLRLDTELTGSYNTGSWVINRRIETENYIILEIPYDSFGINISSSLKQKITGFILPRSYNPDLISKLDEIASKSGLESSNGNALGLGNLGGF